MSTSTAPTPSPAEAAAGSATAGPDDERSLWDWDRTVLRRIALALLGLQALWRAWIAFQGSFTGDDFVFTANASQQPLGWDYLMREHVGHLMPGAFALVKGLDAIAPMSYPLVVLVDLGLQALAGWVMFGLLVLLFGPRKGVIVPLAFFLFTPLTLDAFLWWAAALNFLPLQLGMVLTLYAHVRYVRERSTTWLLLSLPSFLVALAFFEKAVLIPPYLLLFTLLYLHPDGPLRARVWQTVRENWRLWLLYGVVCAGYVVLYLTRNTFSFDYRPSTPTVAQLTGRVVGTTVIPGLFGGPWHFAPIGFSSGIADPHGWAKWLSWELLVVAVVASVAVRQRAARAWSLFAAYLAADVVLLAVGRVSWVGPVIGQSYRYVADAAVPATMTLALLLLPLTDEGRPLTRIGAAVARRLQNRRWIPVAAAAVAINAFLFSAAYTTQRDADLWSGNPVAPYLANARQSLAAAGEDVVLLDQPVPAEVLNGLFAPYNGTAYVFAPLRDRPRFGGSTAELWVFTEDGTLVPGRVSGVDSKPGPLTNCGWPIRNGGTASVDLRQSVYAWAWTVRISYLAGKTTPAVVRLGGTQRRVVLQKGLHDLYLPVTGAGGYVDITALDRAAGVCVDSLTVGLRYPRDEHPATGATAPGSG